MTWPAALSCAALRVLRTAAGRRALQVVLLVGGLFALGFLCGEQAHAAEGVPTVTSTGVVPTASAEEVRSSVRGGIERLVDAPTGSTSPRSRTASPPRPTAPANDRAEERHSGSSTGPVHSSSGQVLRPVTGQVVRSVDDRVLRRVGDAVERVTGGLTQVQVELPALPVLPSLPGLPPLPALPSLPGQIPPAPVAAAPPSAAHASPSDGAHSHRPVDAPVDITYGPSPGIATAAVSAQAGGHRTTQPGQAPAHRAPSHDFNGVLGSQSALDGGASRHSDAHAVTSNHQVPLRSVRGTAACAHAAGARDRYRDIPVFPA
ncbi:hypothetical protein [Streptomyces sp. HUAS ZL42]|uniref:hypothetical protein n=1 Tax=Streptomyces sp. HUAS ZL42 TaxID=3231715 RepID=UPI00345E7E2E